MYKVAIRSSGVCTSSPCVSGGQGRDRGGWPPQIELMFGSEIGMHDPPSWCTFIMRLFGHSCSLSEDEGEREQRAGMAWSNAGGDTACRWQPNGGS